MRGERSSRQGVKLLYIRDYLYTHAAKEHPTGVLHSDGFESLRMRKNTGTRMGSSALAGMRDSIQLRSRHRRAGDEQHPTGVLHFDGFESLTTVKTADTQTGICCFWQRMRDSNPRKRSQSPVCYRYTNPLFS